MKRPEEGKFDLEHAHNFGLNHSKSMNVIDSESLERDAGGKPCSAHSAAARRALVEAGERRRHAPSMLPIAKEVNGRDGPEPVRYGDWEVKGIASDF